MKPFFAWPDRIEMLEEVAHSWVGTAFVPNARIKGGGVSCQMLAAEIYGECGHLPESPGVPEGPMDWANAQTSSIIIGWIESMPHRFMDVERPWLPGDLIGFRMGGCVHHLGIVLRHNIMIHCLRPDGVRLNRLDDATYLKRVSRIWRPVE